MRVYIGGPIVRLSQNKPIPEHLRLLFCKARILIPARGFKLGPLPHAFCRSRHGKAFFRTLCRLSKNTKASARKRTGPQSSKIFQKMLPVHPFTNPIKLTSSWRKRQVMIQNKSLASNQLTLHSKDLLQSPVRLLVILRISYLSMVQVEHQGEPGRTERTISGRTGFIRSKARKMHGSGRSYNADWENIFHKSDWGIEDFAATLEGKLMTEMDDKDVYRFSECGN